jgi:hypothetical protein
MTRSRFFLVLCLSAALAAGSLSVAANPGPGGDGPPSIENSLAVQKAILQARDHLVRDEPKKAVDVLEANLALINGDRRYLMTLRDAYRAYIRTLTLSNQAPAADVYQKRLKILDDGDTAAVAPPQVAASSTQAPAGQFARPAPAASVVDVQSSLNNPPALIARGAKPDPFEAGNEAKAPAAAAPAAPALLGKADAEYAQKRWAEAKLLYEKASQADATAVSAEARERWAYCQFQVVTEQLNRFTEQPCDWVKLESDVRLAMSVAPKMNKLGETVLADMQKRKDFAGAKAASAPAAGAVAVKHLGRGASGLLCAETRNFRVFHNQTQDYAEKVAQIAEYTRSQMARKWFGKDGDDWAPKCDIYLHATGADYSRVTGVPANSPGHSRIESDPSNGRVVGRRIDVHCDNPALLEAVLPHETTHVVLAGQFGNQPVPRWVDEGVAVLTEPVEKVNLHRRNLAKGLENRDLIPLRELMTMPDYPQASRIGTFYAQSVTLVDFLARLKGAQVFTQFVRDGVREGYEAALRRHYGMQNFGDLQDRWTERMLAEVGGAAPAYAERKQ